MVVQNASALTSAKEPRRKGGDGPGVLTGSACAGAPKFLQPIDYIDISLRMLRERACFGSQNAVGASRAGHFWRGKAAKRRLTVLCYTQLTTGGRAASSDPMALEISILVNGLRVGARVTQNALN